MITMLDEAACNLLQETHCRRISFQARSNRPRRGAECILRDDSLDVISLSNLFL